MRNKKTRDFVLCAIFSAIIVVMTVVPYTGYISYGILEITTLHIPVIIGAVALGWKYGAVLGGVWGVSNLLRAFTNPLWVLFTNPLISVLPRILVGMVAGAVYALVRKKLHLVPSAIIAAVLGTLTNTVLVLGAINIFGGMFDSYAAFYELFKQVFNVVISVNGSVELAAAVVLTPILATAIQRQEKRL